MKISAKQANLLAKEVVKQLQKLKVGEIPETLINQIKNFRTKRTDLLAQCKIHDDALKAHEGKWKDIVGRNNDDKIWHGGTMEDILDKLKKREMPSVSTIEDEIILNAMFASDDDLQSFVNKIVKKFDKKTRSKILSN